MSDRAEQMREAAIEACRYDDAHDCKEAIRALPLPPQPPLADDVALVRYEFRIMAYGNGDYNLEKDVDDDGDWVKYDDAADLIKRLARDCQDAGIDAAAWREAAKGMEGHRDHWKARAEKAEAELDAAIAAWEDAAIKRGQSDAEVARLREALGNVADSLERTHREVLAMKPSNAQWSGDNIYRAFGHLMGGLTVARSLAIAAICARTP